MKVFDNGVELLNYDVFDNGAGFWLTVNGNPVVMYNSLGGVWQHIKSLVRCGYGNFTVGKNKILAKEWVAKMEYLGYID